MHSLKCDNKKIFEKFCENKGKMHLVVRNSKNFVIGKLLDYKLKKIFQERF